MHKESNSVSEHHCGGDVRNCPPCIREHIQPSFGPHPSHRSSICISSGLMMYRRRRLFRNSSADRIVPLRRFGTVVSQHLVLQILLNHLLTHLVSPFPRLGEKVLSIGLLRLRCTSRFLPFPPLSCGISRRGPDDYYIVSIRIRCFTSQLSRRVQAIY